jgi:hypothetical protein
VKINKLYQLRNYSGSRSHAPAWERRFGASAVAHWVPTPARGNQRRSSYFNFSVKVIYFHFMRNWAFLRWICKLRCFIRANATMPNRSGGHPLPTAGEITSERRVRPTHHVMFLKLHAGLQPAPQRSLSSTQVCNLLRNVFDQPRKRFGRGCAGFIGPAAGKIIRKTTSKLTPSPKRLFCCYVVTKRRNKVNFQLQI